LTMRRVRTMRISFTTRRLLDCWSSIRQPLNDGCGSSPLGGVWSVSMWFNLVQVD
jgi:hypothetical protein